MGKKVCIIGQFPPPIHGLSKAIDTLYNSRLKKKYEFDVINITKNSQFIKNFIKLLFCKSDYYYLTIAQSKMGNIRDLILISIIFLKKKKLVIHLHGGYFRTFLDKEASKLQRRINRIFLNKCSANIVLGKSLKYIFEGITEENKIFVVENCVDDNMIISEYEFINKIKKQNDIINVLYLSNFDESKGYKEVLKLAALCKNNNLKYIKFKFAGNFKDNRDKEYFYKFIEENKLNNYIEYFGVVSGDDKKNLLKNSQAFILLSTYKKEGQPISIIEAMANGLPVITTRHAGIPDLVTDVSNGLLTEYNNLNDILVYIQKIYNDKEYYVTVCRNNRDKMKKEFSETNYINKLDNIFSLL